MFLIDRAKVPKKNALMKKKIRTIERSLIEIYKSTKE